MSGAPTALELADELAMSGAEFDAAGRGALAVMLRAAVELRRQHAVIEALAAIPAQTRDKPSPRATRDADYADGWEFACDDIDDRMAAVIESGGAATVAAVREQVQ